MVGQPQISRNHTMAEDSSKSTISSPSRPDNDHQKTGYDPNSPWTNYFNILTNRMTLAGQDAFREDSYIRNEERDCRRCEEWRDYMFKYSPIVRFMSKNITELNGKLDAENVSCKRCIAKLVQEKDADGNIVERRVRQGGGFSPDHGILICANEMRNRSHLEDTLAHEMVHAHDHLRFKVDWADLRHAACTEIRASSLSGECRWTREFFIRNNWKFTEQHQACVRSRAVRSVMARPSCKDDLHAVKVVNEVWDSCFADTRPFDAIYK